MVRNTCEFVVGHLLEIRMAAGYRDADDLNEMHRMIGGLTSKLPPPAKFALASDWRAVRLMAPDIAVLVREGMLRGNPYLTRAAILTLPANPLTNLQVIRLIRECENPSRRHFTSPKELHGWLSEVLTAAESARLWTFLELPGTPPPIGSSLDER
jgi:hypothetical protein